MTTTAETMMRQALDLFAIDPPDSDFQEGYLCALMVFANEGLGFAWNDPSLVQCENLSTRATAALERRRFEVTAGQRETALLNFYRRERQSGADPLTANERMGDYAKRLDQLEEDCQADLNVIRKCMERAS